MFSHIKAPLTLIGQSCSLRRLSILALLSAGSSMVQAQPAGLTLNEALQLSLQHSPLARAADASVQASREAAAKAGQLPDPILKVGVENVPVDGADRWSTTRDFMTMRRIGVEQQWVSANKRAARSERAQRAIEIEEGSYLAEVAMVRTEAAKAWITVLYAQRVLTLFKAIEQQLAEDLGAIQAAHRGAKATASDVTQAKMALSLAKDATYKSEHDLNTARLALARWTATSIASVVDETPTLVSHVPNLHLEDLERYHPAVLAARRAIAFTDADTTVAARERRADWSIEAGFSQRPQFSNMVSVGISIPLPVNPSQRQDRAIAEKSALGTKARMQYEDAVRASQVEIQSLATTLASMKNRLARLNAELLPAASQQAELAAAAYRAGTGSLSTVFNARRMLHEQRLQITELEKEAALTWAKLEYHIVPKELALAERTAQ